MVPVLSEFGCFLLAKVLVHVVLRLYDLQQENHVFVFISMNRPHFCDRVSRILDMRLFSVTFETPCIVSSWSGEVET